MHHSFKDQYGRSGRVSMQDMQGVRRTGAARRRRERTLRGSYGLVSEAKARGRSSRAYGCTEAASSTGRSPAGDGGESQQEAPGELCRDGTVMRGAGGSAGRVARVGIGAGTNEYAHQAFPIVV